MVIEKIFLSFPGGFILRVVAPLNFAKLDNLAAGDSAGKRENLDWFFPHRSNHYPAESFPGALYLSAVYQPSLHGTSSTGKHEDVMNS